MDDNLKLTLSGNEMAALQYILSILIVIEKHVPIRLKPNFASYKPMRNGINAEILRLKNYKHIGCLDYGGSKELNFSRMKKVLRSASSIHKIKIENSMQKNMENMYTHTSSKIFGLQLYKVSNINENQRQFLLKTLKNYKFVNSILIDEVPISSHNRKKESPFLHSSIKAMRRLKTLILNGTTSNKQSVSVFPMVFSSLTRIENIKLSFGNIGESDIIHLHKSLLALSNLKNFYLEVPEQIFSKRNLFLLKNWIDSMHFRERGVLSINSCGFTQDLTIFQDSSALELHFKLLGGINELAQNLQRIPKIKLPITIDVNFHPDDIKNHPNTELFLKEIAEFPNLRGFRQNFYFHIDVCDLTNCYPYWANILTHYHYQKMRILHMSVPVSGANVDNALVLINLMLPNMYNLEDLSLTLNRDGPSDKAFYLSGGIVDLIKKLKDITTLRSLEFNTEIEIVINVLSDFFIHLTNLSQIAYLKSEWMQISKKAFQIFCSRIAHMQSLCELELHVYSLMEISLDDLRSCFSALSSNIKNMKFFNKIRLSADNECFKDAKPWKELDTLLKKLFQNKIIEVGLGFFEF